MANRVGTRTPGCEYPLQWRSGRSSRTHLVQVRQLVTDRVDVDEVQVRHSFHLPSNPMALSVSSLVACRPVEEQVVRVHIDFHSPSNRWHRKVERDPATTGKQQRLDLGHDRDTPSAKSFADFNLWV